MSTATETGKAAKPQNVVSIAKVRAGFDSLGHDELEVIKKAFFPLDTSEVEMAYCLSVAKTLNLNPLTKEIMFIARSVCIEENGKENWVKKVEPTVGRDGYLAVAHRTRGTYGGMETTHQITEFPVVDEKGNWSSKKDLTATCKVYRTDTTMPTTVTVAYSEYVQLKKLDKTPTKFWKEKPVTMLQKVAESQALRKAFDISGVYSLEEINVESEELLRVPDNWDLNDSVTPAGTSNDESKEPLTPASKVIDAKLTQQALETERQTLKATGLDCEVKDGFCYIVGNVSLDKKKIIKGLGFKFMRSKAGSEGWFKKVG